MELPTSSRLTAGVHLRKLRMAKALRLKDVERLSRAIADDKGDFAYCITSGRLSQMENNDSIPGMFKLASLSAIYEVSLGELLRIYGIEVDLHR